MSIKSELRMCVADYIRKYLKEYGKKENIPEEIRGDPSIYYIWKIELAEFQVEDIAEDIIDEIKNTLRKHIFTSVFGDDEDE